VTKSEKLIYKYASLEKRAKDGWGWNLLHGGLDVAGLVPLVGNVADLANAGIYGARGQAGNAALSLAAAVPGVGYGASAAKGAKWTAKGYKAVKAGTKGAPKVLNKTKNAIGTKLTQQTAETISKAPLGVQKVIKATNKGAHTIGETISKVPTGLKPFKPGGKSNALVKSFARFRGVENLLEGGEGAGVPGAKALNTGYNAVLDNTVGKVGEGIGYGIGQFMPTDPKNVSPSSTNKTITKADSTINNVVNSGAGSSKQTTTSDPKPAKSNTFIDEPGRAVRRQAYNNINSILNKKKDQ
jgi:hypothetical protein